METPQRRLDDWIQSYLEFTQYHIAEEQFHLWTALGVLSAAVNSSRWMDGGYYKTFPNLYILFIGPSSVGKSTSSGIGISLIREAQLQVSIFSDSLTAAALIEFMSLATVTWELDGVIHKKTPTLIYASELGTLINRRNSVEELTLVLTELFNKVADFESRTKTGGKTLVYLPNLTFFACCFPEWIDEVLNSISLRSGFLGRMLVIRSTKKRFKSTKKLPPGNAILRKDLIHDLQIISNQYGEMVWSPRAKAKLEAWTDTLPLDLTSQEAIEIQGFTGRKPQYVQRLAMLHAISRKDGYNMVDVQDFDFGFEQIEYCEKQTRDLKPKPLHLVKVERVRHVIILLNLKKKNKKDLLPIRDLMPHTFRQMNTDDLNACIQTLCELGFCELVGRKIRVLDESKGGEL